MAKKNKEEPSPRDLVKTPSMAKMLGISKRSLRRLARVYGAPCFKECFPPGNGRGPRQIGWDPERVINWLKTTGRMGEDGVVFARPNPRLLKRLGKESKDTVGKKSRRLKPEKEKTIKLSYELAAVPGVVGVGLAHLLGAFAFSCKHGGIPPILQRGLEDAGLESLSPKSLEMISKLAKATSTTEAQWIMIKQALPTLIKK